MQSHAPTLIPHDEDRYLVIDPAIKFTIKRQIDAEPFNICDAWTNPKIFELWITPPGHQLVECTIGPDETTTFVLKADGEHNAPIEYFLDWATYIPDRKIEFRCWNSQVPGMNETDAVNLSIEIGESSNFPHNICTPYELKLGYDNPSLWHCTSHVGLHTFWLEATQRMAQLVEGHTDIMRQLKLTRDCAAE